jgi:hypothetical protein
MPYIIRKLPNKDLYRVKLTKNNKIVAYATKNPLKVIQAIEINKKKL